MISVILGHFSIHHVLFYVFQTTSDGTPVRNLMFTYMSLLMKTANHVALLIPDKTTSEGQRKHAKEICEIAFAKHPQFVSQASEASFRTLSDPKYCGKMKVRFYVSKEF